MDLVIQNKLFIISVFSCVYVINIRTSKHMYTYMTSEQIFKQTNIRIENFIMFIYNISISIYNSQVTMLVTEPLRNGLTNCCVFFTVYLIGRRISCKLYFIRGCPRLNFFSYFFLIWHQN